MKSNIPRKVVQAFGGLTKASRALDTAITTVDSWQRAGRIPSWRRPLIIEAAERESVNLPPEFLAQEVEGAA